MSKVEFVDLTGDDDEEMEVASATETSFAAPSRSLQLKGESRSVRGLSEDSGGTKSFCWSIFRRHCMFLTHSRFRITVQAEV